MHLQVIKDGNGKNTGIFIPINDWDTLTKKHSDLKQLVVLEQSSPAKKKLSDLAGKLSHETAEELQKHIQESRNEWEERLNKQI